MEKTEVEATPRFIQISCCSLSQTEEDQVVGESHVLYALDNKGMVWYYSNVVDDWKELGDLPT